MGISGPIPPHTESSHRSGGASLSLEPNTPRPGRRWPSAALLCCTWLCGTLLAACSEPAPPPKNANTAPGYPGTLLPVTAVKHDFQWRQHVTARWRDGTHSFDAVLAKDGDSLRLLGLGPMGTPGFVLTLTQGRVTFENRSPEHFEFEPRHVMLDVQRTFYPWFSAPPPLDGVREQHLAGEHIVERWRAGKLMQRRFERDDQQPPGTIVVDYSNWGDDNAAPGRAVLNNGWFGYSLTVDTLEQQRLSPEPAAPHGGELSTDGTGHGVEKPNSRLADLPRGD